MMARIWPNAKLQTLADYTGYNSVYDMLGAAQLDNSVPGICINSWCDFVAYVEPDQDAGWCEECAMHTVQSALVVAGLI